MTEPGAETKPTRFPILVIGDTGGVHVRTRARAVADLGYDVHVLTPRQSGDPGLREIAAPSISRVAGEIRRAPGDVVHVHYASSIGAWAFVATGDRRPLVVSVMGGDVLFGEQGHHAWPARWLIRQVLARADWVTAKSQHLAQALIALGVAPARLETVYWGVDCARFRPGDKARARRDLGLTDGGPLIFSPRILRRLYRTDVVVRAMVDIRRQYPGARLVIAEYEADPVYKAELGRLADELGVADAVTFAGVIPHDRMPTYYAAADVAVGIPPSDGFPQTVFEAMACGTPNVVARLSRYEEVMADGQSAVFVEPTATGVAAGVARILDEPALAARIRDAGIEIVREKADLGREAARVSGIYQRLRPTAPRPARPLWVRVLARALLAALTVRNGYRAVPAAGDASARAAPAP